MVVLQLVLLNVFIIPAYAGIVYVLYQEINSLAYILFVIIVHLHNSSHELDNIYMYMFVIMLITLVVFVN